MIYMFVSLLDHEDAEEAVSTSLTRPPLFLGLDHEDAGGKRKQVIHTYPLHLVAWSGKWKNPEHLYSWFLFFPGLDHKDAEEAGTMFDIFAIFWGLIMKMFTNPKARYGFFVFLFGA